MILAPVSGELFGDLGFALAAVPIAQFCQFPRIQTLLHSPNPITRFGHQRSFVPYQVRSMHTCSAGRKAPFNIPTLCNRWIHSQSVGSDFLSRAATPAICLASANSTLKPAASSTSWGRDPAHPRALTLPPIPPSVPSAICTSHTAPVSLPQRQSPPAPPHPTPGRTQSVVRSPDQFPQPAAESLVFLRPRCCAARILSTFPTLLHRTLLPFGARPPRLANFTESDLEECHEGLANVRLPSWSQTCRAELSRLIEGP